ncbi:MAG: hypothetical protein AAGD06_19950 [Acidobacteriota bacterium]
MSQRLPHFAASSILRLRAAGAGGAMAGAQIPTSIRSLAKGRSMGMRMYMCMCLKDIGTATVRTRTAEEAT